MIISERIFKIMEECKMSQIEFSKKTGISQSTISDWKRKKTNPAADKIMIISEVLGVTPYEILQNSGKSEKNKKNDYLIVSKGTENYDFLIEIDALSHEKKERLRGYLSALKEE
ncbi:MAG: helix-turn-helix transcriptional regulator [Lachnospiraceae bacterium]|nr:helix-turn-helix transcriptional regulator [Lachnospiraceae bacterium]